MQLCGTLLTALYTHIPRRFYGDVRRLMGLAWAVVGVCLTQTVHFNHWGEVVLGRAQYASSHQCRFERWLHNKHIKPVKLFMPLIRATLHLWPPEGLVYRPSIPVT